MNISVLNVGHILFIPQPSKRRNFFLTHPVDKENEHSIMPYSTRPCLTLPYCTLPYPALPCPTLPHPTLPYPTLPYLTILYQVNFNTLLLSFFFYLTLSVFINLLFIFRLHLSMVLIYGLTLKHQDVIYKTVRFVFMPSSN